MDLTTTTVPDSTQVNAEDFIGGPRTVTITGVRAGTAEQPVNFDLGEYPGRAYRPGKSMRRVLIAAWGAETNNYVGRRLTLYNDPTIKFGPMTTGGIRISHLSHIDKPLTIALTVTRGKRAPYVVQPLPAEVKPSTPAPTLEDAIARANRARTKAELRHFYKVAAGLGMDEHTAADLRALDETLPDAEVNA
jgi:hypothetical protein